jgi:hypothetical protein
LTASSLNSAVYACFGIFISCLPKVTLILGHPWQTKFRGKLTLHEHHPQSPAQQPFRQNRGVVLSMPSNEVHIGIVADPSVDQFVVRGIDILVVQDAH